MKSFVEEDFDFAVLVVEVLDFVLAENPDLGAIPVFFPMAPENFLKDEILHQAA